MHDTCAMDLGVGEVLEDPRTGGFCVFRVQDDFESRFIQDLDRVVADMAGTATWSASSGQWGVGGQLTLVAWAL